MKVAKFKVRVNYEANEYQITALDKQYAYFNCLCRSMADMFNTIYKITKDLRNQQTRSVFTFE